MILYYILYDKILLWHIQKKAGSQQHYSVILVFEILYYYIFVYNTPVFLNILSNLTLITATIQLKRYRLNKLSV